MPVEYGADTLKQKEVLSPQGPTLEKWRVVAEEELHTLATRGVYSVATPEQVKARCPALPNGASLELQHY